MKLVGLIMNDAQSYLFVETKLAIKLDNQLYLQAVRLNENIQIIVAHYHPCLSLDRALVSASASMVVLVMTKGSNLHDSILNNLDKNLIVWSDFIDTNVQQKLEAKVAGWNKSFNVNDWEGVLDFFNILPVRRLPQALILSAGNCKGIGYGLELMMLSSINWSELQSADLNNEEKAIKRVKTNVKAWIKEYEKQ